MIFTCSDPDFKELSMSQNCCGLPPHGLHLNPEMNNWSPHQLTAHIMQARIDYHKTGKRNILTFDDVFKPRDWIFDEVALSHMDIGVTKYVYAMRKQATLRHLLQEKWNNLNSYANPRNYFHAKVLPAGVVDGNLVYQYNPMPYEKVWVDEGIKLDYEWVPKCPQK